ncbi:3alpha(or 20beta)-hydroxysteroid dehydrogenase [Faunimonas pinastri]|uniref:3alpha(Or 20beta)-hydroxysteroid dehydrogenase n=1 Tax=Faunimonas pinastri TaxID=1855383 RepID=A0A1H9DZR1_9HYPH|nr:glucose 1-dehydrogenase [Faunimonas pinastri]SEQ19009.1 3alpha(or 20beta)-hydroxysteroid dehydrogenase [Faunimonas pinastri]
MIEPTEMQPLAGRVALVTGGAQGIGAAVAARLAADGAHVFIGDIRAPAEGATASVGERPVFLPLDVTSEADWGAAMERVARDCGRLDILVNNAGIYGPASLQDETAAGFRRLFEINQFAIFWGMKSAVPLMTLGGSIINLSSIGGMVGYKGTFGYAGTKWAVRGLTRSAARELAPLKIRVNTVCPGVIDTPMFYENDPSLLNQFLETIPLGALGKPTDIASAVAFLASENACYITGSDILVDGGMLA